MKGLTRTLWTIFAPIAVAALAAIACGDGGAATPAPRMEALGDPADAHGDYDGDSTAIAVGHALELPRERRGDADYFRFNAEAGRIYEIDAWNETRWRLPTELRDFHGQIHYREFGETAWKAVKTGYHYLKVEAPENEPYTLFIAPSDYMDDHADNSMAATPLSIGSYTDGSIEYQGDSDCFRFRAESGSHYYIGVDHRSIYHTELILYDANGAPLTYGGGAMGIDSGFVWKSPESGDYYIRISSRKPMNISWRAGPIPPAPPCEAGRIWPDGSPGTYAVGVSLFDVSGDDYPDGATASVSPGKPVIGSLDYSRDVDVFSFQAERGLVYTLHISSETMRSPWAELSEGDAHIGRAYPEMFWRAPKDGAYNISVKSYDDNDAGMYTLNVFAGVADDHADHPEQGATPIAPGEIVDAAIDNERDRDFFVLRAEAGREYLIRYGQLNPLTILNVTLRIHASPPVEASAPNMDGNTLRDTAVLRWTAPADGDYHVEVATRSKNTGTYRLVIE